MDLECGGISSKQFFNKYPDFEKDFCSHFEFNYGLLNICDKIKPSVQYILSNTNEVHYNYLRKHRELSIFKDNNIFLSHEIGLRKPDINIYTFVQKTLNIEANNIYFVDDRQENLVSPRKMGWNVFLYQNNNNDLLKFLNV